MPVAAYAWSSSQNSRRASGSTPAVGSSSSRSCGSCSRQAASARRCFQPPDSVPASCSPRAREAQPVERRVDARGAVGHPVHPRDEREVLADREVVPEREPLRHVARAALDLPRLGADVVAQARALAGVGREQPAEHPDRRRLAAAVRSEEAEDLAAPHRQREVAHDVVLAEVLVEAAHVDDDVGNVGRGSGAHGSVTSTGWPGFSFAASAAAGLASTRKTSFARFSFE